MNLRRLASGTLVEVDETGKAATFRCDWLVRVPSNNPEPDSEADCWREVECGAIVRVHPSYPDAPLGDALLCDAGHDRLCMEIDLAPYGPQWQREQANRF